MIDIRDHLRNYDAEFDPSKPEGFGQRIGPEVLRDGAFELKIVDAQTDLITVDNAQAPVLRVDLVVLPGSPQEGTAFQKVYWLTGSIEVNILGADLVTLGIDADRWPSQGRRFSDGIMEAAPQLVGRCFKATKKAKAGKNGKTFHNLYVNERINGPAAPMPSATPPTRQQSFAAPPTQYAAPAPASRYADDEIPF